MAELLDLDAEVLHAHLSEMTNWVSTLATTPPRRILDLGSGTGAGTFALLERFAHSEATALDTSAPMLHHLMNKARTLGVADRVSTLQADLDTTWPTIDPVDLVWASLSLHHLADPDRVLSEIRTTLNPGGLLIVVEMDTFPRFLPDDLGLGHPGLEARCHTALAAAHATRVPLLGTDWGPRLTRAGFTIEGHRPRTINLTPPLPATTHRYAQATLHRIRTSLDDQLNPEDLKTLDTLLDSPGPAGLLQREDLTVRTTRTGWVGRRPTTP